MVSPSVRNGGNAASARAPPQWTIAPTNRPFLPLEPQNTSATSPLSLTPRAPGKEAEEEAEEGAAASLAVEVEPDGRAARGGVDPDQVGDGVHQQQAAPAPLVPGGRAAAGERVVQPAAVAYLAHQL